MKTGMFKQFVDLSEQSALAPTMNPTQSAANNPAMDPAKNKLAMQAKTELAKSKAAVAQPTANPMQQKQQLDKLKSLSDMLQKHQMTGKMQDIEKQLQDMMPQGNGAPTQLQQPRPGTGV